jgi:hypothetical protein
VDRVISPPAKLLPEKLSRPPGLSENCIGPVCAAPAKEIW